MYLRTTRRRNRDGSEVCYYALAENHRHPEKGHVEARVVHSFGRADKLDRAVLERLVASIRRVLVEESGGPAVEGRSADGIEIEAVFELGVIHVVKALWEQLGIGAAITSRFEPLRKRGHSKEGRDNDPQIVIALAVTREGVPVRSWIFPGNTPDVTTVQKVKDDLREMRLGRTLFVGDAGMYSRGNLEELAKGAGKYILATPIRRVKEVKDEVLSHPGRYAEIAPNLRAKEVIVGDGERRRRYILCLNEEEANRQKWHRAEILETLKAELAALKKDHPKRACQLLASKRYGPYLGQDENGRPCLDQAKIKRAEHLDGKFVLTTNDDTLSVADIALGYKGMWIIESCFRRMKTTGLEVRPMFHWMPHRITAHVKLCVLALMIQRAAEIATDMTWRQIQVALEPVKAVRYTAEGQSIVQASKIRPETRDILKKLDISTPKPILGRACERNGGLS